jgi:hypothetical protein
MDSIDPSGQVIAMSVFNGLCTNCTILAIRGKLTFEDGTEVSPTQGM